MRPVTLPARATALLLIDVVNDLAFEGSEALIMQAEPMALPVAALGDLRIERLVLAGIPGNICVLFTANDAYMRGFRLYAPEDCIVSNTPEDNAYALRQIATVMKGRTQPSTYLRFRAGAARRRSQSAGARGR